MGQKLGIHPVKTGNPISEKLVLKHKKIKLTSEKIKPSPEGQKATNYKVRQVENKSQRIKVSICRRHCKKEENPDIKSKPKKGHGDISQSKANQTIFQEDPKQPKSGAINPTKKVTIREPADPIE